MGVRNEVPTGDKLAQSQKRKWKKRWASEGDSEGSPLRVRYSIIWPRGFIITVSCGQLPSQTVLISFTSPFPEPLVSVHAWVFPGYPLAQGTENYFHCCEAGKMLPLLSFWKIKQVLALHPAVNGYLVDLFDSKTDSMTALRSLLSSLRKLCLALSALFFIQHNPAALVSCPLSLTILHKLLLLLFSFSSMNISSRREHKPTPSP